jgi:hypothetical protein
MRQFGIGWHRIARQKKRIEEVERHMKERQEQAEGSRELRFGLRKRLGEGNLGSLEVVGVYRRYHQVHIRGFYAKHIKPHIEELETHGGDFGILRKSPDRYYSDEAGKCRWTLTFRDESGLDKYLEYLEFAQEE